MTVAELIALLQTMPQDMPVFADGVTDECEWDIGSVEQKTIEVRHYEQVKEGPYSWGRHWRESAEVVVLGTS